MHLWRIPAALIVAILTVAVTAPAASAARVPRSAPRVVHYAKTIIAPDLAGQTGAVRASVDGCYQLRTGGDMCAVRLTLLTATCVTVTQVRQRPWDWTDIESWCSEGELY